MLEKWLETNHQAPNPGDFYGDERWHIGQVWSCCKVLRNTLKLQNLAWELWSLSRQSSLMNALIMGKLIFFVDVQGEGIGKMMETCKYPGIFNWPWQSHRTYGMLPFSESSSYLFSRKLRCFSFRIEEHFPDAEVPHALLKPEELPVTVEMETPIESVEVEEVTVPPSKDQVDTPQVGLRWTKNTCHLLNLPTFLSKMDEHMLYLK